MKPAGVITAGVLMLSAITGAACASSPPASLTPTQWPPASSTASASAAPPTPSERSPASSTASPSPAPPGAISIPVGREPREVAAADLNADGFLDAAIANSGDGTLTLLIGAPEGPPLRPGQTLRAGQEPSDLKAVDVDQDGDPDLVVANHGTSQLTVLINDGRAAFTAAPYSPLETGAVPHLHGLVSGDFNADGWPDLAVESADTRTVSLLHGSELGFLPPLHVPVNTMPYFRLGMIAGPTGGGPQILVPGHSTDTIAVVRYAGDGYVTDTLIELDSQPWAVTSDDVSGDAQADIIVVETGSLSIWLAGGGTFSPASGSPYAIPGATGVATGDLNGDLIADIVVGPWEGDEIVLVNSADFSIDRLVACEQPVGLAIADFAGDGRPDLLVTCPTQDTVILLTFPRPN